VVGGVARLLLLLLDPFEQGREGVAQGAEATLTEDLGVGRPDLRYGLARVLEQGDPRLGEADALGAAVVGIRHPLHVAEALHVVDERAHRLLGHAGGGGQVGQPAAALERQVDQHHRVGHLHALVLAVAEGDLHAELEVAHEAHQQPGEVVAAEVVERAGASGRAIGHAHMVR